MLHISSLRGMAAWKLNGNLYFLVSLDTKSNEHIYGL